MLRILCLLILLALGTEAFAQDNRPWRMAGTKKINPERLTRRFRWSSPSAACSLLGDLPGMQTGNYKNDPSRPKEYFCSSPNKSIGNGLPVENNLAYYVVGDNTTAKELQLALNVSDVPAAKIGRTVLAVTSDLLAKRALDAALPADVLESLLSGRAGKWNVGEIQILIVREDWRSGGGYEMTFIIRPRNL
jgi:hypothetical protein